MDSVNKGLRKILDQLIIIDMSCRFFNILSTAPLQLRVVYGRGLIPFKKFKELKWKT